jgi:fermentation-respiration switch protein FrsA (DUF1100 family)
MNSLLKRSALALSVVALLYASACVYMWSTQMDQVFEPTPVLQTTPDRLGMKYDAMRIPVGSGEEQGELDAWWVPALQAHAPVVIYFHGNYRNIGNNLEHTLRLHRLGFNVLLADYRGYGKSSGGKPSEIKMYEDAEAVWQYLIKQRGGQPGNSFIYGHSLGGAVAIDLAVHHPEAAGLITESTFTSMRAMGEKDYGFLPVDYLLSQRFESLQKMPQLKLPLLLIHGTWDKKVPVEMASQLYVAAHEPKKLLLVEGGEHNNSAAIAWVEYSDTLGAFVRQNIR